MKLAFYTGPECGLCDLADDILAQSQHQRELDITKYNIREDTQLYHLYGARIPVLKRQDTQQELGWPFDLETLELFLQ
ncbi:glutaredoxin family protein [Alteromonas pelagimontana]|uniref:Glutaredoxin family protein n=1 Tax=Alteromonas pelagimontana TaxID=1858656 RepID=A0A6M4MKL4_9ALTE|nr:glutaredoxin family protein [Alteromonas pelagimontana]QJR82616.1 glutaredoxin family protein [Alteromonas pelagimontana]